MERWRGRVALVTGAASGIGKAAVHALLTHGLKVVGVDIDLGGLDKLAATLGDVPPAGGSFFPIGCDLRKEEDILKVFEDIKSKHGGVDACLNIAGVGHRGSILSGDTSKWRDMLDVNVMAYAIVSREAVKQMRTRGVADGQVIFINSNCGHEIRPGMPDFSMYNVTKFAVTALVTSLRHELKELKSHIRVSAVSPEIVQTEFTHRMFPGDEACVDELYRNRKCLQPEDVADAIVYILGTLPHVQVHDIRIFPTE